jgi:ribosome-dependent ATPase
MAREKMGEQRDTMPIELQTRYAYNQDFRSINAMVPAVIPMLLMFIPAILTALGVVREKELGSITNLYVTPMTRLEFVMGKQLPYIAVAMVSLVLLALQAVLIFRVPIKGSVLALFVLGLIYVMGTTGLGLLISTFTRTQVAALAAAAICTMLPTTQFSGLTVPTASLGPMGMAIGRVWPATYFMMTSRGIFAKALRLPDLGPELLVLCIFPPVLILLSTAFLSKQEK